MYIYIYIYQRFCKASFGKYLYIYYIYNIYIYVCVYKLYFHIDFYCEISNLENLKNQSHDTSHDLL